MDREKVIKALNDALTAKKNYPWASTRMSFEFIEMLIDLLEEQEKEIKALRLLVEWAEECDFGFDQFPDEYERYKDEIKDMKYIDGMIHVAKRTLEDHGVFEESR